MTRARERRDCSLSQWPTIVCARAGYLQTHSITMTTPDTTTATPIQDFSKCHAGILIKLDNLQGLPGLLDAASRARQTAQEALDFFREAIFEHHSEEERELFPAVQASANAGEERDRLKAVAERLTQEHRDLEAQWKKLEPGLKRVAKGQDSDLDAAAVDKLVTQYVAHARFEEAEYLPQAYTVLSRHANRMDALALALHLRHAPAVVGYV